MDCRKGSSQERSWVEAGTPYWPEIRGIVREAKRKKKI
jgi:hypothetical protein